MYRNTLFMAIIFYVADDAADDVADDEADDAAWPGYFPLAENRAERGLKKISGEISGKKKRLFNR